MYYFIKIACLSTCMSLHRATHPLMHVSYAFNACLLCGNPEFDHAITISIMITLFYFVTLNLNMAMLLLLALPYICAIWYSFSTHSSYITSLTTIMPKRASPNDFKSCSSSKKKKKYSITDAHPDLVIPNLVSPSARIKYQTMRHNLKSVVCLLLTSRSVHP